MILLFTLVNILTENAITHPAWIAVALKCSITVNTSPISWANVTSVKTVSSFYTGEAIPIKSSITLTSYKR